MNISCHTFVPSVSQNEISDTRKRIFYSYYSFLGFNVTAFPSANGYYSTPTSASVISSVIPAIPYQVFSSRSSDIIPILLY